jgi:hypothetical protein
LPKLDAAHLAEDLQMHVKEIRLRDYPYKSHRGLAERIVRGYYVKRGFEVFRGSMLLGKEYSQRYTQYLTVRRRYDRLELALESAVGNDLPALRKRVSKCRGIPDFAIMRGSLAFVEVKLEHEHIKPHQLHCMQILEQYGFKVYVVRLKKKPYRLHTIVNLKSTGKTVVATQERLWKRYAK